MESPQDLSPMLSPEKLAQVEEQFHQSFTLLNSPDDLAKQALFYKALGDSTRLKIIALLLTSELCLCQLVELTQIPTSTMTHHLQVLNRGGIITTNRVGKFTLYSIRAEHKDTLSQILGQNTKEIFIQEDEKYVNQS